MNTEFTLFCSLLHDETKWKTFYEFIKKDLTAFDKLSNLDEHDHVIQFETILMK